MSDTGDLEDQLFNKVAPMVAPILESNARSFARQLGLTHSEALNEARYGLMIALRRYDYNDSRGGIFNFVKKAVHRHFLKLWAVAKAQSRRPHIQVLDANGDKKAKPVPFIKPEQLLNITPSNGHGRADHSVQTDFMDLLEARLSLTEAPPAPDAELAAEDEARTMERLQAALREALSERDRLVLQCKVSPPRGLQMLMLDELAQEPTIPLICRYLNLTKNEVDWALRRIREKTLELIVKDFSDLKDRSIVRAYAERRP